MPRIGILALQGAYDAHREALNDIDCEAVLVRRPDELKGIAGLIVPGGESTTMSNLLRSSELLEPMRDAVSDGLPMFGTCAGMIVLASRIEDGRPDQVHLDALPIGVRRNAYGRQVDSFETDLDVEGLDAPFHAVFIRAPLLTDAAPDVVVLARYGDVPVLVRHESRLVSSFHPELTGDRRIHQMFVDIVSSHTALTR